MELLFSGIDTIIGNVLESLGMYGPILGCILILFESIIPILPLSVFITLNFYTFGNILGFLISYILSIVGCSFAAYISSLYKVHFQKVLNKHNKSRVLNLINRFSGITFPELVLLIAFPFSPAFFLNIAAGITNLDYKKFVLACVVGKPFMVYFWGYIGVSLLHSLSQPIYLLRIAAILLVAYVVSKLINKKLKLD